MGRHGTPPPQGKPGRAPGRKPPEPGRRPSRARGRTAAVTVVLVLAAGGGAFAVLRGGLVPAGGTCHAGTVRVEAVASPDIAPVLAGIAERARRSGTLTDGRCLDVTVSARASSEVTAELASPKGKAPGFSVWIPDDGAAVDQVPASAGGATLTPLGSVAQSPVVVGALAAQANALGWPNRTYTWAQLAGAAAQTGLRLGTPDPAHTSTGLLALAMITGSIGRTGGSDTDTESAGAAKLLARRTAPTEAQAVAALPRGSGRAELADPARDQALVLSEQAAFQHNGGAGPPLRLFYPKDGAATLDYPFITVDPGDLSVDQARAAERFETLLSEPDALRALTAAGFRAPHRPAPPATVRRAGGSSPQPVDASPAPSPSAPDLQKLGLLWQITVQSARITTVVDVSGSMATAVPGAGGRTRLDVTRASLEQALGQFTDRDEIGLWRFSTLLDGSRDYQQLVDTGQLGEKAAGGGTRRDRLDAAFRALRPVPDGSTGLYDTSLAVYRQATASYVAGKFNAVVILTDGANEDPGSISLDALTSELKTLGDPRRPVPLIAIAVGPDADEAACDRITRATGGAAYRVSDPAQIQAVLLKAVVAAAASAAAAAP